MVSAAKAHFRAAVRGKRLPTGSLAEIEPRLAEDPTYLLTLQEKYGPYFRAWLNGKITTCIFGIERGRRFLVQNEDKVTGATIDFKPMFPHGVLRQMNGDTHRDYRRRFIEALKATRIETHEASIHDIVRDFLAEAAADVQPAKIDAICTKAKLALTKIMFRLLFSIEQDWHDFDRLLSLYDQYAPDGTFKRALPIHRDYLDQMETIVLSRGSEIAESPAIPSMLAFLQAGGRLDETAIGNLLQMAEAARFDTMGLWLWLVRMLGSNSWVFDWIANEKDPEKRATYCEAVVMEALRLEQSEFLLRRATSDIEFDGFFIPKGTIVRIAIWETHKDPAKFKDPFKFDPKRFLGPGKLADAYAPFGLDKHRCLGADWVIRISAIFVEEAALGFRWSIVSELRLPCSGHFTLNRALPFP